MSYDTGDLSLCRNFHFQDRWSLRGIPPLEFDPELIVTTPFFFYYSYFRKAAWRNITPRGRYNYIIFYVFCYRAVEKNCLYSRRVLLSQTLVFLLNPRKNDFANCSSSISLDLLFFKFCFFLKVVCRLKKNWQFPHTVRHPIFNYNQTQNLKWKLKHEIVTNHTAVFVILNVLKPIFGL